MHEGSAAHTPGAQQGRARRQAVKAVRASTRCDRSTPPGAPCVRRCSRRCRPRPARPRRWSRWPAARRRRRTGCATSSGLAKRRIRLDGRFSARNRASISVADTPRSCAMPAMNATAPSVRVGRASRHHQRQQVFLGARRMAQPRRRRLFPGGQGGLALRRGGLDRAHQPAVELVRDRPEARVAIAAHVVKAHAAADDQHAFVAKRGERAAGIEVRLRVQVLAQRELHHRDVGVGDISFAGMNMP